MTLPRVTPLQFLVLALLAKKEEIPGRILRELLAKNGAPSSGPQFYQLMSRIEDAGYIKGWYAQKEIRNQVVNERRYRITDHGREAWKSTVDFYTSDFGDSHAEEPSNALHCVV